MRIPQRSKHTQHVGFYLTPELYAELETVRQANDLKMSDLMRFIVQQFIEDYKNGEQKNQVATHE